MLVYFTDAITKEKIAVNPKYVIVVFILHDGEMKGKTVIGLSSGNLVVDESQIDVVGVLQGQIE